MKNLRNVFAATLFIVGSFYAQAQSKVAHINTQELIEAMPRTKEAMADLQKKSNEAQSNIEEMVKELEANNQKYSEDLKSLAEQFQNEINSAEQGAKTESEMISARELAQSRAQEYQREEQNAATKVRESEDRIRQYQLNMQKEIQEYRDLLLKPIMDDVKKAIKKVGTAQGFDYVLDYGQNTGVLMANGKDLLADVKAELGF